MDANFTSLCDDNSVELGNEGLGNKYFKSLDNKVETKLTRMNLPHYWERVNHLLVPLHPDEKLGRITPFDYVPHLLIYAHEWHKILVSKIEEEDLPVTLLRDQIIFRFFNDYAPNCVVFTITIDDYLKVTMITDTGGFLIATFNYNGNISNYLSPDKFIKEGKYWPTSLFKT